MSITQSLGEKIVLQMAQMFKHQNPHLQTVKSSLSMMEYRSEEH